MARQYAVDDSRWPEVFVINGYALFMGYLMMGVRGLGLLVITWTTVVLLGGFVSDLGKKDFWCLTGITLIQTAGVFNFILKERINDTFYSSFGLIISMIATFSKDGVGVGRKGLIVFVLLAIQVLVFGVIFCALGVLYMLGMYISAGVSLWRLIEHDFGDTGGANQRPSLQVLYMLAVAQGAIFGYKTIYALVTGSQLTNLVAGDLDKELIEVYIEEAVAGCERNLSFASGRNFVTYGVDLMKDAKSNEGFIAGIKVLGGLLDVVPDVVPSYYQSQYSSKKVLAKYLLTRSDYSSAIIERLLETVGPRSPYSREIKEHVLRILDIIAPCIRLEQFPRAIECLCSVVDTSESNESRGYGIKFKDYERVDLLDEYEKDYIESQPVRGYGSPNSRTTRRFDNAFFRNLRKEAKKRTGFNWMLIKGTNVIHKLVADEDNRWILRTCVSNTVLHRIARFPIKFHRENHDPFDRNEKSKLQMLEQCWVLTEWLLVALTETSSPCLQPAATSIGEGRRQRRRSRRRSEEIEEEVEEGEEQLLLLRSMDSSAIGSTIKRTIKDSIESTIKCIFDCLHCGVTQKRQAIQILLHLSLDMSFIVNDSESSKRRLSWVLLLIFCSTDDDSERWMVPSLTYWKKICCDINGIRRLAGQKLSEMLREKHELPSEESARELQSINLAHGDLKSALDADSEDISIRTHAGIIMEDLRRHDYDTRFSELQGSLVDAIPEVVTEKSIPCGSITAERQEQSTDLEMGNVSQDNQDGSLDIE